MERIRCSLLSIISSSCYITRDYIVGINQEEEEEEEEEEGVFPLFILSLNSAI